MEALVEATLRLAAPLLLAALGELLVERSGVVNIGVEGTMLTGAFVGFVAAVASGSPELGAAMAALAGASTGAGFAFFALARRADPIVVGTALNLLALGATGLASRALYAGAAPVAPALPAWRIPGLAELPGVGALFVQTPFVYAALSGCAVLGVFLSRTRAGLRLRAVGEAARAADAEGIDVGHTRAWALVVGGGLAGLAGAALPLALADTFTEGMTAGRGFIALAVVIFGRWTAAGTLAAALFFGAATALQFRLQARGFAVPYPVFLMLPYLLTLLTLAVFSGRSRAPADLGRPYRREASP